MPFQVINASEIEVGDPVTAQLLGKVKNSFDDHETRIGNVEAASGTVVVFDEVVYNASEFTTLTGLLIFRASFDFTLTEAKLAIFEKGSYTGFLEVDIQKGASLDPMDFATVFTAKPVINYSTISDYGEGVSGSYDVAEKDILAGEYLRLDITEVPVGGPVPTFVLIFYGEV